MTVLQEAGGKGMEVPGQVWIDLSCNPVRIFLPVAWNVTLSHGACDLLEIFTVAASMKAAPRKHLVASIDRSIALT